MALRVAWLSDIHLNFLDEEGRLEFLAAIRSQALDAVVITGDIGEGPTVERYLQMAQDALAMPIYFVLGNHDFYGGSIVDVRKRVESLAGSSQHLTYLTRCGAVRLTANTCMVGHDGWADARLGDYTNSRVRLNDHLVIRELLGYNHRERRIVLEGLGDEAAGHFRAALAEVPETCGRVVAVIHPPPFREASQYQGRISNDEWLPHFACAAVGEVLREYASARPACQVMVLCGHTHGGCEVQIADNLTVLAAGAEYGQPAVQRVLEVE